tara:strand:+ start:121 stop:441 length:321 start_codon:yes stop_codon:yes gene_type:complete
MGRGQSSKGKRECGATLVSSCPCGWEWSRFVAIDEKRRQSMMDRVERQHQKVCKSCVGWERQMEVGTAFTRHNQPHNVIKGLMDENKAAMKNNNYEKYEKDQESSK